MREPKHGTPYEYRKGCRCEVCRAANAAYQKDYQARKKLKAQTAGAQ